ncbi:MAG: hypothetical protein K2H22_00350, partial [Muribaculaceae bacterium]|nr:hypothetical protein [Muribaculaceae bacterium]
MNLNRFHIFRILLLLAAAGTFSGIVIYADPNAPLEPIPYELPEVKVSTKHRPILHLTGYIRELSTMTSSADTLLLYREKWVDFMIPTGKEKRYKGWSDPRLLKTKSYYKWTDSSGLDSVSDRA